MNYDGLYKSEGTEAMNQFVRKILRKVKRSGDCRTSHLAKLFCLCLQKQIDSCIQDQPSTEQG